MKIISAQYILSIELPTSNTIKVISEEGEFFVPITLRGASRIGMDYQLPEESSSPRDLSSEVVNTLSTSCFLSARKVIQL